MNPEFPVYIISKGRANYQLTHRELRAMGVPHKVVIEPVDYPAYSRTVDDSYLLVLPFSDLGQGSIPVRNWVWDHSILSNHSHHWIMDDNIEGFHRLHRNEKFKTMTGTPLRCMEDYVQRYSNVGIAGPNYYAFCKKTDPVPPFYLNTRVYSCLLINNAIPFRWRGKYNEDTDLCLRALKKGFCTILFNAFLIGKVTTMRMSGGNTDHVYTDGDDRRKFAESLYEQHPDVVQITRKFSRWHHQVDYSQFKRNELKLRDGVKIPSDTNYKLKLIENEKKEEQ